MKVLKEYFLFIIMLICICYKLTNAVNVVIKLDSREQIIFYDVYQVEFSDTDMLKMMYHADFVRYCGNSIAKYVFKFPNSSEEKLYIVKNINITFNSPLSFLDPFKLIGTITKYGNTSMEVTIRGVSNVNRKPEVLKQLFKFLKSRDLRYYLKNGLEGEQLLDTIRKEAADATENVEVEDIPGVTTDVTDDVITDTNGSAVSSKTGLNTYTRNSNAPFKKPLHNAENVKHKCIHYFTAVYTLVKINKFGQKEAIDNAFKNQFPPMKNDDFEKLLTVLC